MTYYPLQLPNVFFESPSLDSENKNHTTAKATTIRVTLDIPKISHTTTRISTSKSNLLVIIIYFN